jgi:hypothetical protein
MVSVFIWIGAVAVAVLLVGLPLWRVAVRVYFEEKMRHVQRMMGMGVPSDKVTVIKGNNKDLN